jgi:hypothetical protein
LKTLAIAPFIIDNLVPAAQLTAELIAIPRFNRTSYEQFEKDIDVSACLAVLHLAAQGCINNHAHTSRFWRAMRLDFVLMILSQHQAVEDFDMMLQLLAMSILKESIGPIAPEPDAELQLPQARYIIDRVSLLLINNPTVPEGAMKHDACIIADLRFQILRTLEAFCQITWGGAAVAAHPNAIGRLVKLMSNELDALYDYRSGHKQRSITTPILRVGSLTMKKIVLVLSASQHAFFTTSQQSTKNLWICKRNCPGSMAGAKSISSVLLG